MRRWSGISLNGYEMQNPGSDAGIFVCEPLDAAV
jgi:hypothetical protein